MRSAEEILNDWVQKTTAAASTKYRAGVMGVKIAPTQLAAAAVDRYVAGVQRAIADGSYVNGLNAVSLTDWQNITATKGAANIATGVNAAKEKVRRNLQKLLPLAQQIKDTVRSMPKGTMEDSIARVRFAMQTMKDAYGKSA